VLDGADPERGVQGLIPTEDQRRLRCGLGSCVAAHGMGSELKPSRTKRLAIMFSCRRSRSDIPSRRDANLAIPWVR
jgi:hypothetical protein